MRCHYEVLGVRFDATDKEITKAYRALALQWHPDKNMDNIERATEEFKCIRAAYTVLRDPNERSFYDANRASFLAQETPVESDPVESPLTNLYRFLSHTCYDGYSDSAKGFYTVYRRLFEKIAENQEMENFESGRNQDACSLPGFGCSISSFDEVVWPFYKYWTRYFRELGEALHSQRDVYYDKRCTVRSRTDEEDLEARQQHVYEVLALIQYVKRRDPRVWAEKKRLENKSKEIRALFAERRLQPSKKQLKQTKECQEPEYVSMAELERQNEYVEKMLKKRFWEPMNDGSSTESDSEHEAYCWICHESYTSDFKSHKKTKKHQRLATLPSGSNPIEHLMKGKKSPAKIIWLPLSNDTNAGLDSRSGTTSKSESHSEGNYTFSPTRESYSQNEEKARSLQRRYERDASAADYAQNTTIESEQEDEEEIRQSRKSWLHSQSLTKSQRRRRQFSESRSPDLKQSPNRKI